MRGFYNPCLTLRMKTKRGGYPLITFNVSHIRGPGKTTNWTHLITDYVFDNPTIPGYEEEEKKLFEEFFAEGGKFVLLTRKRGSLGHVFESVWKHFLNRGVYPQIIKAYEQEAIKGVYSNCYFDVMVKTEKGKEVHKLHVGYVVPLAAADDIKLASGAFVDAGIIFCDEFQPTRKETYLVDEYGAFDMVYNSINKGGKNDTGIRRVPVVFCSNTISLYNPYFVKCGLHKKIQKNTMKYIGDNFVFHRVEKEDTQRARDEEGLGSVFNFETETDKTWINDDENCVMSKIPDAGEPLYDCTLIAGTRAYGVKWYPAVGLYHIDHKPDMTDPMQFNLYTRDLKPNIQTFKSSMRMIRLRKAIGEGIVRFADGMIKEDCLDIMLGGIR